MRNESRPSIPGTLVLVAALGLAAHFLVFAHFRDFLSPDSISYLVGASNLAAGRGFTNSLGDPETIRTPGYPLLLVPFLRAGVDLTYLVALQHLASVLLAVATAAFAFQMSGSRRQALVAGVVMCLDLPTLVVGNSVLTETFFTAVVAISLWLLWRAAQSPDRPWGLSILSGLLAGASVLIRPITLFFLVPAVVFLVLVRKRFKATAVCSFALSFAIFPLLWTVRNYHEAGYPGLSTLPAWDMLGFRAAGVLAIDDPGDFQANLERRQQQLQKQVCDQLQAVDASECRPLIEEQRLIPVKSQYYMRLGRSIVEQHPVAYAKLSLRGVALILLGNDADLAAQVTGMRAGVAARVMLIYTLPLLGFALLGAWTLWKQQRAFFYLAALTLAYFLVVSAGAEAYSRFRVSFMPLYALLVASGLDFLLTKRGRGPVSAAAG